MLTAIFDRRSGQTHFLADPAPPILALLAEAPATAETLMARLAERYELVDPDPAALAARLEELVAAGLVTRG